MRKPLPWPWNKVLASPSSKSGGVVGLPDAARSRHAIVFGGTGVGKSMFLMVLVFLDVLRRVTGHSQRGVAVIDVHGDLYKKLRAYVAILAKYFPALYDLVVIIDVTNPNWSVRFNPLELQVGELPERKADNLANLVTTLFHEEPTTVVRMYRVVYHTFLALILAKRSLPDVPRFLTDRQFREGIVQSIHHAELRRYWFTEFPARAKAERDAREMVESTLNRMGRFSADKDLAFLFSGASTINFRELMDSGKIVLVNGAKGRLGEGASYMLCAFLVSAFEQAAYGREDISEVARTPFTLVCDEAMNYVTESVTDIIKQARKYGLELLLATQEVRGNPRTDALLASVLNVVGSILTFRLGYADAEALVKDIFTPDLDQARDYRMNWQKPFGVSVLYREPIYRPLPEIWETEIRKITQLPDQMLWMKWRSKPGSQLIKTLAVPDIRELPDAADLPRLLQLQDEAAYHLAGVSKEMTENPQPHEKKAPQSVDLDSNDYDHID